MQLCSVLDWDYNHCCKGGAGGNEGPIGHIDCARIWNRMQHGSIVQDNFVILSSPLLHFFFFAHLARSLTF